MPPTHRHVLPRSLIFLSLIFLSSFPRRSPQARTLARKYPNAPREWPWQFVFPADKLCPHPRTGKYARYHLHEPSLQRNFTTAIRRSDIAKRVTCHILIHCFAIHLLQSGTDIRTVQSLPGHSSVETTKISLHLLNRPAARGPSPLNLS